MQAWDFTINWWVFIPCMLLGVIILFVGFVWMMSAPMYYHAKAYRELHKSTEKMRAEGQIIDIGGFPTYIGNLTPEEVAQKQRQAEEWRLKQEFDEAFIGPRKPRVKAKVLTFFRDQIDLIEVEESPEDAVHTDWLLEQHPTGSSKS